MRRWISMVAAGLLLALGALAAVGCGADDDADAAGDAAERPAIVVTTPTLGAVVSEVVADRAEVHVVMPNGADPHDYSPSAREISRLQNADLVVENGLQLEEGMLAPLERARGRGVTFFTATDHVELREGGGHSHAHGDEDHGHGAEAGRKDDHGDDHSHNGDDHDHNGEGHSHNGDDHGHGAGDESHGHNDEGHGAEGEGHGHDHAHDGDDPHVWMDPIAMRDVVRALAPVLERELGLDVSERAGAVASQMEELDERVRATLADIPERQRRLVSGHESMGYFADRYDLEVVGLLLPSLSSQAEVSAANLARLRQRIEEESITVIFSETGTPAGVADAIGRETGARVVEIDTHTLPEDGSYETFIMGVATTVAEAYDAAS